MADSLAAVSTSNLTTSASSTLDKPVYPNYYQQDVSTSNLTTSSLVKPDDPTDNSEKSGNLAQSTGPPKNEAPDGGFRAWAAVAGGFCCLFVSFGWINCIGVFQDYYQTHQLQDLSSSTVSWIPSVETFVMFIGGPFYGRAFDSYGPRALLLGGSFFHVLGLMMTSICNKYYQFILAQSICSALGASATFFASTTAISTWFHHRRALALGISASGSGLGGVIFPIMVDRLVPLVGFGWAMRICAFLILFLLAIANLTVTSRLKHTPRRVRIMDFIDPLKDTAFALTVTGGFLFFWGMFLPFTFLILQAKRTGVSGTLIPYLVPILNAGSFIGRSLPGYIGDLIGRFNAIIVVSYFSGILILGLWIPSNSAATAVAFSALIGFSTGAFIALTPAVVAQISEIRQIGVRMGTFFAICSAAALTGNPIGAAFIPNADTSPFWKLQVFSGVVILAGSTFFLFARIYIAGFSLFKKV